MERYTIADGTVAHRMRGAREHHQLEENAPGHSPAEGRKASQSGSAAFGPSCCPEGTAVLDSRNCSLPIGARGAAFLDRDGVINENANVNSPDDLILIPGSAHAISRLNKAGVPVVIVTNQGGIAMGHLSEESLARIHVHLRKLLAEHGTKADAIYYCPHMPNARIATYRLDCPCRKPGSGMLEKASDQFGIDLAKSVLVGDATTDILAGARAGCRTILVKTGFGGNDGKAAAVPDDVVADLSAAVDLILGSARAAEPRAADP